MTIKQRQRLISNLLSRAISKRGCVPFAAVDDRLVDTLCGIIHTLYRQLEAKGMNHDEIIAALNVAVEEGSL